MGVGVGSGKWEAGSGGEVSKADEKNEKRRQKGVHKIKVSRNERVELTKEVESESKDRPPCANLSRREATPNSSKVLQSNIWPLRK